MLQFDQYNQDVFTRLKGLVNKRDGIYNSTGYKWVLENKIIIGNKRTPADAMHYFGVEAAADQIMVYVDAMAIWAGYGSRSQVPVRYGFVMDDYGVVSFWKIGNKGNMREGAAPDPSKTKLEWTRPDTADFAHLVPSEEEVEAKKEADFRKAIGAADGENLGEVKQRMNFGECELVVSKLVDEVHVAYNTTYEKYWNMYKDVNGNVIYHTGVPAPIEVGEKVNLTATVKKHIVNKKNERVTIVARPTIK